MLIKQISIFVENKFGRLAKIVETLGENGINLSALSIADTTDFGILRIIVDNTELAVKVLGESGIIAKCTDVIAVAVDDKPGGLSNVLDALTANEITIEYMYAFTGRKSGKALMVVRTDNIEKSEDVLKKNNIETVSLENIC